MPSKIVIDDATLEVLNAGLDMMVDAARVELAMLPRKQVVATHTETNYAAFGRDPATMAIALAMAVVRLAEKGGRPQ